MDDKVVKTEVHPIELDEDLSLYSFIGQKRAVSILRAFANQYLNDKMEGRNPQLPAIQIRGYPQSGKRTLSLAFANSIFGCPVIEYGIGKTLSFGWDNIQNYIQNGTSSSVFYIDGAEELTNYVQTVLYKLLREQILYIPIRDEQKFEKIKFSIKPLIIFSISPDSWLIPELRDVINLEIEMERYTEFELLHILEQRCKYLGWSAKKNILRYIVLKGDASRVGKIIKILEMTYKIARADNRDTLEMKDAERAVELLVKKKSKGE